MTQYEGQGEEPPIKELFSVFEVAIFCSDHNHVLPGVQPVSAVPFIPLIPNASPHPSFVLLLCFPFSLPLWRLLLPFMNSWKHSAEPQLFFCQDKLLLDVSSVPFPSALLSSVQSCQLTARHDYGSIEIARPEQLHCIFGVSGNYLPQKTTRREDR